MDVNSMYEDMDMGLLAVDLAFLEYWALVHVTPGSPLSVSDVTPMTRPLAAQQ